MLASVVAVSFAVPPAVQEALAGRSAEVFVMDTDGLMLYDRDAAEAGAPEGALYVDGELVGYLPGVTRL